MLTEYRPSAGHEFWSEHWGRHPVEELLSIARRSPLTNLIARALPSSGTILEAGCGTGQYVLLLRERGWRVAGADWVVEPLAACRRVAPVPLAAMKLEELAVRDGALAGYLSLGAVEHDEHGPDAILAEARRALGPGGILVLSVPYVNGVRRLTAPWLRRRSRAVKEHGGTFYQFVFTRRELWAALGRHGFSPVSSAPYDPARLLKKALPGGLARRLAPPPAGSGRSAHGASPE
ncbi:MAG: class I SAM-dependent methyltransferase, partial [Candidatus Rokuibacteriota bacterium]